LQPSPIRFQLGLMQLCPCFHQAPLLPWQRTRDQLDRLNAEYPDLVLAVRVKMGGVMWWLASANMRIMIPKNRLISGTYSFYIAGHRRSATVVFPDDLFFEHQ
jgi:hypothetical protein